MAVQLLKLQLTFVVKSEDTVMFPYDKIVKIGVLVPFILMRKNHKFLNFLCEIIFYHLMLGMRYLLIYLVSYSHVPFAPL